MKNLKRTLFMCSVLTACAGIQAQTYFEEVSDLLGVNHTYADIAFYAGGVSLYDFDGDGWDDLTIASGNGDSIYFYRNVGGSFEKLPSLVPDIRETKQINWVDFDNDGDADLWLAHRNAANRLYENDGSLNLTDITNAAGLTTAAMVSYGSAWGDYDLDGDLDLYVCNYSGIAADGRNFLYRNNGDGTFTDVTSVAGLPVSGAPSFQTAFVDVNNDGWPDLYEANDKVDYMNFLWINQGNGTFKDESLASGAGLMMDAMCVAFGDYDGNGFLDLYITNTPSPGNILLRNNGDMTFSEVSDICEVEMQSCGWGANFMDVDNNMVEDIYACSGMPTPLKPSYLYMNPGDGTAFTDIVLDGDTTNSYAVASGDWDQDGFMDMAVTNLGHHTQLWSNTSSSGNWLRIDLEGTISNREAVGTWLHCYVGGNKMIRYTHNGIGFCSQNSRTQFFGTGEYDMIDSLVVMWPSGMVETFYDVCTGATLKLVEGMNTLPGAVSITQSGTLCEGSTTVLSATGFADYQWSNGDWGANATIDAPGEYTVFAYAANGLCSSASINVSELPSPYIAFYDISIDPVGITATVSLSIIGGSGSWTVLWDDPLGQTTETATGLLVGQTYEVVITDANGCSVSQSIFIGSPSGLTDISRELTLYPNPASGYFEFQADFSGRAVLQLFSSQGKVVLSRNVIGNQHAGGTLRVDATELASGLYLVRLHAENAVHSGWISIE